MKREIENQILKLKQERRKLKQGKEETEKGTKETEKERRKLKRLMNCTVTVVRDLKVYNMNSSI